MTSESVSLLDRPIPLSMSRWLSLDHVIYMSKMSPIIGGIREMSTTTRFLYEHIAVQRITAQPTSAKCKHYPVMKVKKTKPDIDSISRVVCSQASEWREIDSSLVIAVCGLHERYASLDWKPKAT